MFAEFLLFLLVFPSRHTSVGLTVILGRFSSIICAFVQFPLCLGPLLFGGWSVPIYTCARREGMLSYYSF